MNKTIEGNKNILVRLLLFIFFLLALCVPVYFRGGVFGDNGSALFLYMLFFPVIYISLILIKMKFLSLKSKILYIFFCYVVPTILLYFYMYMELRRGFNLSF